MRIYAVADIHGKKPYIDEVKKNLIRWAPDILVMAGDMTSFFRKNGLASELKRFALPKLAVRGNTDLKPAEQVFIRNRIIIIDKKQFVFKEHDFVGISGTIPLPFLSIIGFPEKKRLAEIEPLVTPHSILVTHPPPRKTLDKAGGKYHAGSINLKHFIEKRKPRLLICGHIHEQSGYALHGRTLVVNCAMNRTSSGALIDLNKDHDTRIRTLAPGP